MEREITGPVDMCLPNGRLNSAAVGWSRRPLHRPNLKGWGRNKRFEWWCVHTHDFLVTANISHHDYRANLASTFIDLKSGKITAARENKWLPGPGWLSSLDPSEPMIGTGRDIEIHLTPNREGTHIFVESPRVQVDVQVYEPAGHESMGVLVPWDEKRFQYTRKDNCLLAEGRVVVDGVQHAVERGGGYAIHDHGRGRWPYNTTWNWAAGCGDCNGHQIGLNFGGKWSDGTPSTENVLRIDGRLHKISEPVEWIYDRGNWMKPWRIRGARVDLTFTPALYNHYFFNRWLVTARLDQCFGRFDGTIVDDAGATYHVDDIFGHAEEVHRQW